VIRQLEGLVFRRSLQGGWEGSLFLRGKREREEENRGSGSKKGWVGLSWGVNGPTKRAWCGQLD
jgi:hypothetical protein